MDKNQIELESISFDLEGNPKKEESKPQKRTIIAQSEEEFDTVKHQKEA